MEKKKVKKGMNPEIAKMDSTAKSGQRIKWKKKQE